MEYVYFDGSLMRADSKILRISSHALNYGVGAFEGMRALWDNEAATWFFFRPDRHFARLRRGAEYLGMELTLSYDEFVTILSKLLRKNRFQSDVYIRPLVFFATEGVGLMKTGRAVSAVYTEARMLQQLSPCTACLVPQRRPSNGSFAAKITGNYVLSYSAQLAARNRKYQVGILLSDQGYVSEASAMNLFWIKNGELFTSSLACGALAGVTRETVMQLSREMPGRKVHEGKYRPAVLSEADEMFICGTGSGITPITRFEKTKLSSSNSRSITARLWDLYSSTLRSRPERYADWFLPCQ